MRKIFFWNRNKVAKATRIIKVNDSIHNTSQKFAKNGISTTKYNIITFLPKNLFEQFRRLANIFFLFLLILLFIPQISSLQPISTLFSLIFVLIVTAIKDGVDDIARYRSDRQINNRRTDILFHQNYVTTYWKNIQVGDIVKIKNNEFIPADMILISTSESNGLCLIETAELDGETNLKPREALVETIDLQDDIEKLTNFNAEIECESPNNNLLRFEGKLTWNEQSYALKNDNLLLRGTRLRNTQWAIGVVCNAGRDTKLMQNSGRPKFKRTKIDHWLNKIILGIFVFLFLMCLIMAICCGFWEYNTGSKFRIYLPRDSDDFISSNLLTGAVEISSLIFFSYIILLNTVVPISLYISIEFIRLLQSKLIDWDNRMYYEPNNIQAQAHTASLNEELGQIQYIFSDKTGTLTQNIMTFKKCSIRGEFYGDLVHETSAGAREIKFAEQDNNFVWYDKTLIDAIERNDDEYIEHFFQCLALCHTVMTEDKNGKILYQAQSPDENALVSAARSFGFVFLSRTQNSITFRNRNRIQTYKLLNILDFNNYRKRMSIIIEKHGKIILYCKGADSVIKERLDPSENEILQLTDEHLHKVACEGLRTLCLAWKELNQHDYNKWSRKLKEATTSMQNREEQIDRLYEDIEQNLKLIGMTAIEDKLQDGVPQCIENLTQAGIKIWMLTGDKTETAENIGLSCRLLTDEMIFKKIEGETEIDVIKELDMFRRELIGKIEEFFHIHINNQTTRLSWENLSIDIGNTEEFQGFCLLITGAALVHALSDRLKMRFLELSTMCKTVICCRVTPLQKAQVVELIMNNDNVITLAIGDGANDVSMIQKAHIGVGISGQEGRQAVLASDYSIGQFRYLERLLLVHGRWSYLRISKFLRYFFYKNFAFTFCQFWFAFYCGFSAQTIFDAFFVTTYNIFFTTCPVLVLGILDQDISANHSISKPHLYIAGQKDKFFNRKIFFECALHGLITSCIIFFFSYLCLSPSTHTSGIPLTDTQSFGFMVATILVFVVNLENAIEMWYWTWIYIFILFGTIILHFIFHFIMYSTILRVTFKINYSYVGITQIVLSNSIFWFTLLLICVILLLPIIGREFFRIRFMPNETDKARLAQKYRQQTSDYPLEHRPRQRTASATSTASGYAFSQQNGFGSRILSGTLRNKSTISYIEEQTIF